MNRVNQVYNDDAAISMVLVDGTDRLNFDTVAEGDRTGRPVRRAPLLHASTRRRTTTSRGSCPTATSAPWYATRPCSAS